MIDLLFYIWLSQSSFGVSVIILRILEVSFNWYFNFMLYKTMLYIYKVTVIVFTLWLAYYNSIWSVDIIFVYILIMLLFLRTFIHIKDSFSYKKTIIFFLNSGMYWVNIQQEMCIRKPKDWNFYFALYGRLNKKSKHILYSRKMDHRVE